MQLTDRQRQILIGTLLGDGCLEWNKANFRLRIDHAVKQEEYVRWKHREFAPFVKGEPKLIEVFDKRTKKTYGHWRFNTTTSDVLKEYGRMFYRNNKKVIPVSIHTNFTTPLALAVWFMDDGFNRKDCLGKYFNTQAYSMEEQEILQNCLEKNFGTRTQVHWAAGRPRLYVNASQSEHLVQLIQPYILPSMKYKILNPVTTETPIRA